MLTDAFVVLAYFFEIFHFLRNFEGFYFAHIYLFESLACLQTDVFFLVILILVDCITKFAFKAIWLSTRSF